MKQWFKQFGKYSKVALVAVLENKMRTFLTVLGIIIGVGAVVLMTSIGKGTESLILGSVSSFGSNLLYMEPGSIEDLSSVITARDRLKYRDYLKLNKADWLENVTPLMGYETMVVAGSSNEKTMVIGTTHGYSSALNFYAQKGRFIEDFDVTNSAKIIVLGYKFADKLFGDQNPVGQDVRIHGLSYKVVGVMEEQGGNVAESYDDLVFIPITTMRTYLFGADYIQELIAGTVGPMDQALEKTKVLMRQLHQIDNPEGDPAKDDFMVMSQEQAMDIFTTVSGVLTLFMVLIASISLVVGGIGIMNIMMVSVNQRTMEIGLRKAVGATRTDILLQFLIEAIIITMIGGLLGIGSGVGLAFLLSLIIEKYQAGWEFLIDYPALIIVVFVAALIGVVFGLYPARKAAKLDPIEALRYE